MYSRAAAAGLVKTPSKVSLAHCNVCSMAFGNIGTNSVGLCLDVDVRVHFEGSSRGNCGLGLTNIA
ncbi:hypothetical protein BpHYR1_005617 [Brachionus plicatilis]|uniref:Uncharacterized protein n=1 Tax=Brachionus plicatilis TaxID=10195 RepID=A0A3M7P7B5_BRAPC|nr:hypothetical protein BpHYR1_005617 [Brachionus plicatilis]